MSIKAQIRILKQKIKLPWLVKIVDGFVPKEERADKVIYVHIDLNKGTENGQTR